MEKIKLTNKQLDIVSQIADENQPFWLDVRPSFRNRHSHLISITGKDFSLILRQVHQKQNEKREAVQIRTMEVAKILSEEITQRFPGSLFKGVNGESDEPTENAR